MGKMTVKNTPFIKKADVILIIAIALLCVAFLLPKYLSKTSVTAVVYNDGVEVESIDLSSVKEAYDIELDCSPSATLTVEPGTIYYSHADCHDKLCVNCGKLTKPGDTAACLPSKTLIVLESNNGQQEDASAPDVITY